jgi:hypothetical protein
VSALVVSTLVESVVIESFLVESTVVESVVAVEEPLQAANEVAIAKAKNAILNEFFMLTFFKVTI